MFKVNNRNTRTRCEICSKLTIKTPERRQWRRSGFFIVNFEHILLLVLVFLLLTLSRCFRTALLQNTFKELFLYFLLLKSFLVFSLDYKRCKTRVFLSIILQCFPKIHQKTGFKTCGLNFFLEKKYSVNGIVSSKWHTLDRSSHRRCSVRKGVLRNFTKVTGKHQC